MLRSTKSVLTALAATGGLVLSGAATTHGQEPPGSVPAAEQPTVPPAPPAAEDASTVVTLPTGERMVVHQGERGPAAWFVADEAAATAGDQTGPAGDRVFAHSRTEDSLRVIPTDLVPLVPDRLDPRLFDVTLLAEVAAGETVPVIVELTDGHGHPATGDATMLSELATRFTASTGVDIEHQLRSVGAVSADVGPADFAALVDAVGKDPAESGVHRVWLSGPVQAALADSTGQIGAPGAWARGLTGEGTVVAVLDSGVDADHPDLTGQVVGEVNFSTSGDVLDRNGHGTHVAGTIAGTGTADPTYTGVAHGADLLNVKVLNDSGGGQEAHIIAGMEWAVDEGADVVNMSLGSWATDGTDPMSEALDSLSEDSGALFVVAAGNEGEFGPRTVSAPATADRALAVGSVDKEDALSDFSSLGPRLGDEAVKPDVTAPGEYIVAARAGGTDGPYPISEHYTGYSGTSMAAPHVAGAAAILLQDRPELSGEQVKALLMGSSTGTTDTVWQEGAGRIGIPDALDQVTTAQPASLSYGVLAHPHEDPAVEEITYHNTGSDDVVLDLAVTAQGPDGTPVPDGAVALGAEQLTVPAEATASLEVTVNPALTDAGLHSGVVTGTDEDGATLRTPLGFRTEAELFDLTVTLLDWDGAPSEGGYVNVFDMDAGTVLEEFVSTQGEPATLAVPAGTFLVSASDTDWGPDPARTALVMDPGVVVTEDTEVVLDLREAEVVQVDTMPPTTGGWGMAAHNARDATGHRLWQHGNASLGRTVDFYTMPTAPAAVGEFEFHYGQRRPATTGPGTLAGPPQLPYLYDFFTWDDRVPEDLTFVADESTTATVPTTHRATTDEAPGVIVFDGRMPVTPGLGLAGVGFLISTENPAARTDYVSAEGVWDTVVQLTANDVTTQLELRSEQQVHAPGAAQPQEWLGQVHSTGLSRFTAEPEVVRDGTALRFTLPVMVDGSGHGSQVRAPGDTTRLEVFADGVPVGTSETFVTSYNFPADPLTYRVVAEVERAEDWWPLSTSSTTEWTFTSGGTAGPVAVPVLDVRFQPQHLSADNLVTRVVDLEVEITHQAGAETDAVLEEVVVEWAAGDGWAEAELADLGDGRYGTQLEVPTGVDTVDLRASAADSDGTTVTTEVHDALGLESPVTRVAGEDRYATAAALARSGGYSPRAYLASGMDYPDALSVGGIAGAEAAPVLLSQQDSLPAVVIEALADVQASEVRILGGTAAVGTEVEAELDALGLQVDRVGGADRYETAALLAEGAAPGGTVFVASGQEYADALAAGPMSAARGLPVLLTRDDHLPRVTREVLQELAPEQIVLVGGSGRVDEGVLAELTAIAATERVGGTHRYDTAALLAQRHEGGGPGDGFASSTALLAAGQDWPDALTLAARAGAQGSPILLVRPDWVPTATAAAIEVLESRRAVVVGGSAVVEDAVLEALEALLVPAG